MAYLSHTTAEIDRLTEKCIETTSISPDLYAKYDVKRGLRDINGNGVRKKKCRQRVNFTTEE